MPWPDGSTLPRSLSSLEQRLTPYENVKNYGAVGDGVTDDTAAFIACRIAIFASTVARPGGALMLTKRMYIPEGKYLITSPGALMNAPGGATGQYLGYHVMGAGRFQTEILYHGVTGALAINPDIFQHVTFEDFSVHGDNANAIFLLSTAQGNAAQNYTFRNWGLEGVWNEGIQLAGNASANNNSELLWDKCFAHGIYTGAFFHSGSGGANQAQDQFVNFDFNACELEITTGTIIKIDYGGALRVRGGSMIVITSGLCFDFNTGTHSRGATSALVEGQRVEVRNSACKLIECDWKFGAITFLSCDFTVSDPSWTIATFYGSNDTGAYVLWENCQIAGKHEYKYDSVTYLATAPRARYASCVIGQYDDMQNMIVNTAVGGTGNVGGAWLVEFDECTGKDNFGANGADRSYDVVMNWQARKNSGVSRRSLSLKTQGGTLPSSSGGFGSTIDVWLPLRCIITDIHCSRPAGGADAATGWSYTLRTSEGTPTVLATIAPGTAYNLGWVVHVHDVWFLADSDAKRHLVLTAAAITSFDTSGLFVIDYLPGS